MSISISPLALKLDPENPRFVILENREQADIRKYLVTYEDACQLTVAINEYGRLLPGERIVVLEENGEYVVVEGNRRTCSLQFLLSRDLIPDGFAHRIPATSKKILENCQSIEVDVLSDRDEALELMTKRHIQGVKEWKPLAKKQFFASSYNNGQGQSVQNLSKITGVGKGSIENGIRDYKFFLSAYDRYSDAHPDFNREIIVLKTDPFWRIFNSKFKLPSGIEVSAKKFLKISYDDTFNTVSELPSEIFEQITQLVFEKAIVKEEITTRNTLSDIEEIRPLLQAIMNSEDESKEDAATEGTTADADNTSPSPTIAGNEEQLSQDETPGRPTSEQGDNTNGNVGSGGPRPGGPPPRTFFETIGWRDKLEPTNQEHQGLLHAIDELHRLSTLNCGRQKAYKSFPIATGMVLRTVYEQALRLRLIQVNLWGTYMSSLGTGRRTPLPTLSTMENFINQAANKTDVFPDQTMVLCFDRVIAATHRDYLNANIHCPGDINVTSESLESIAAGGMYALVQGIIDLIE